MALNRNNPFQSGSHWRRWNPHVHAPGTLINDQFNADWEGYLASIENASPTVEVVGITDYYSIETYKAVKAAKTGGRLSNVKLIFPNVEFRMSIETERQKGINLHLLFCPDDLDHVERIERALSMLHFEYKGHQYRCTLADLALLGKAHDDRIVNDDSACSQGANQFKVTLPDLRRLFRDDKWVAENCLVAVSASNNDGTAGLQNDASFAALRKEIERFAHFILSSNRKTREFWLGDSGADDLRKLQENYGGRKPCLHGCDAHDVAKTCKPAEDRFCWIKGDPTFESLRQSLLEPDQRVWIGPAAPNRHDASQCIAQLTTGKTPWISNDGVPLNAGLVAIIGSRGSGKTALADIMAVGADVLAPQVADTSFIHRATHPTNHLSEAFVNLHWGDGTRVARWMSVATSGHGGPMVRYLSQQFVEQLCSSEGLGVELRKEIERVVFETIPSEERCDAGDFEELAAVHLNPIRRSREVGQEEIGSISDKITHAEILQSRVPTFTKEQTDRAARIKKAREEMAVLTPKDKEAHAARLVVLEEAHKKLNGAVEKLSRSKLRVDDLKREVDSIRNVTAPRRLAKLKEDFVETSLTDTDWAAFELVFKGNVDQVLADRSAAIAKRIKFFIEGDGSLIDVTVDSVEKWPLNVLNPERDKARELVGLDGQKQLRYTQLQKQIASDERSLEKATSDLALANGAEQRRKALGERRRTLYVEVFQSFLDEQRILESLYSALHGSLKDATGSLSKLRLAVTREIEIDAWVRMGEERLDLRKESALRGHGALKAQVEKYLLNAWSSGTAEQVGEAMQIFVKEMYPEFLKSMPSSITPDKKTAWIQQLAAWLNSTDHISMRYSITYDRVAVEHLSPGTRGIVLLLLYLVIDQQDRRPLIIDQPEENLDPKSVFEELVPHFRNARTRRQVVIVTHNANLVVNTDADQVIVASSEPSATGGLPKVTYQCGSLENPEIRKSVCEILEGGEQAFLDRERRYRLHRRIEASN